MPHAGEKHNGPQILFVIRIHRHIHITHKWNHSLRVNVHHNDQLYIYLSEIMAEIRLCIFSARVHTHTYTHNRMHEVQ